MLETPLLKLPRTLKVLRTLSLPHKYGVLERLYGKALNAHGIAFVEMAGGIRWKLDLRNPTHRWCIYESIFDPVTAKWLRENLRAGGVVIDSGANIGQALIEFARHSSVRIFAFEPLPKCQQWIEESLALNQDVVASVVPLGLWKQPGQLEFQVAGTGDIHGAHATLRTDWYSEKEFARILIDLITLDEFAAAEGIESIRFWKLDVEGAELEALMGAETLLKEGKIQSLLVETNASKSGVIQYMAQFGYLPYVLDRQSHPIPWRAHQAPVSDYVFLPQA
jgi:FkbM family methyltransferase